MLEVILGLNTFILGWLGYQEMRLRNMRTDLKDKIEDETDSLKDSIKRVESKLDALTMLLVEIQLKEMNKGK